MAYFTHRFDAEITLHEAGPYRHTVVYLPGELAADLPFHQSARLRIEADVAGIPVKGAWQPSGGRWFLMLPKVPLRRAGLAIGARVEVAFKLAPPDEVDVPPALAQRLQAQPAVQAAWQALSPGKRRALAHWLSTAKTAPTVAARLAQVQGVILGELPEPWKRRSRGGGGAA